MMSGTKNVQRDKIITQLKESYGCNAYHRDTGFGSQSSLLNHLKKHREHTKKINNSFSMNKLNNLIKEIEEKQANRNK